MATKDEELEKDKKLATRNDNSDTSGDTDANAGGGATLPTGKEERKIGRQVRQERREENQQRRQAEREEHREYVKENGTVIGNELRALGKGLKADWQNDMNALKGRRNGDPAAKTTEETSENPAPVAPTPTNVEPTDVTPTENKVVSPAPTTEETEVEKTDGQDVDGATGVVSQGADSDLTPEQVVSKYGGDAERLKEAGFNPDGTPLSAETNLDEIDDKDLTPEQAVEKYKTKEELEAHGFNEDGTPLSVDDEDNDEIYQRLIEQYGDEEAFPDEYAKYKRNAPTTGTEAGGGAGGTEGGEAGDEGTLPQPPAIPNAEDDETVKGIEQANATRDKAWSDYINFYEDFLKQKEEYDRQRQERDSRNAFWRSIGEVGASLVNLLGVSGAFSGKNAYGRGAYSSMQKFDLTTPKLTEKMWADIDKRKERMDELKQKMMENKLKWQEVVAGGQEKGGTAKGAAADKQYTREYTQYKDQATVGESARQFNETMKEKKREFDVTNQTNKDIAALNNNTKLYLKNYEQNGKTENKWVDWTFNIDGKPRTLRARAGSLYKVFETTSTRLADEIAKTMGFDNYERYKRVLEGIDSKDKGTKADSQDELEAMRKRYIQSNVSGATVKFDDEGNITDVEVPEGTSEAAKADALAVAEKYAEMWNDHISRLEGYENAKSEIDWDGSMTGSNKNFVTNWVMDAGPYYDRYGQYIADFLETQAAILGESNAPDENGFV